MEQTNTELDIFKPTLPELVKANLKPVSFTQKTIIVNSEEDLQKAKLIVDGIDEKVSYFKDYISPIKSLLDKAHKVVTAFEKDNLAFGASLKTIQSNEISDYNRRVFECQSKQKKLMEQLVNSIPLMEQTIAQGKLDFENGLNQRFAKQELERIQALPIPIAEKIDAIEKAKEEVVKEPVKVVVPQVVTSAPKIINKKDEKQEVKTYFIKDEIKAIDYIIDKYYTAMKSNDFANATFYRELLSIGLAKKQINEALKNEDFRKLNFVGCTSEFK